MKKFNGTCLVFGCILLAIFVFSWINWDMEAWMINMSIIPIAILFIKGFYGKKSTLFFELSVLVGLTIGVIIVSLLARNVSANEILVSSLVAVGSAGVVAVILYLGRKYG